MRYFEIRLLFSPRLHCRKIFFGEVKATEKNVIYMKKLVQSRIKKLSKFHIRT